MPVLALAVALAATGRAAAEPCVAANGEPVWAERAVSGDEIVLVDGRRVRLATIAVPRPPLAADAAERGEAQRIAAAARAALAEAVEGREIVLHATGTDRHGRVVGHLYDIETGQWIEAALVADGRAWVVPRPNDRTCARDLLGREAEARQAGRGLWASAVFAVRSTAAEDLLGLVGRRVVVEGRVRSVGRSGGRIWLNFGDDFRRDFAVVMNDKELDRFRAAGIDPTALRGGWVRVRGVVMRRDGPRIAVEVPEDVERVRER